MFFSSWPRSGEIDLMESRGNRKLFDGDNNVGAERFASTLHFGPVWNVKSERTITKNSAPDQGYDRDFHNYQMEWTPDRIVFRIDDETINDIAPPDGGFWELGGFNNRPGSGNNPWNYKMAPFDQEFYFIINLAVGGTNGYFTDGLRNEGPAKPWSDTSSETIRQFWDARNDWLPTWKLNENDASDASLQIDYVRVWAV